MITIECVTKNDLPALSYLYYQLTGIQSEIKNMETVFLQIKDNPKYQLLAAKDNNNHLAGTAMGIICQDLTGTCKPFLLVENVIVDANYRRQGIGKILINSLESFARENGCTLMILVPSSKWQEAHEFYQALGFLKDNAKGFKKGLS